MFLTNPLVISLLTGLTVYLLVSGISNRSKAKARKSAFEQRLEDFRRQSTMSDAVMSQSSSGGRSSDETGILRKVGLFLEELSFKGKSGSAFLRMLDERLTLAGNPRGWQAIDFVAFCTLFIGGIVVGIGILVQAGFFPVFLYLPLVGLSLMYPYTFIKGHISRRKEQAFAELPYFLDQLILGLSSGASTLDASIRSVVLDEGPATLRDSKRVLVREFRRAYLEQASQARPSGEAYRAAAARIQVQEIDDLVEVILEGSQGGSPIIHTLESMSEHVYIVFEQNMATLIKKKDTPFTVATVIIMISTAILITTPIIITVTKALSGGV